MKIFIDCGTNYFQGLSQFHEMYKFDSDWQIYCFEANPETYKNALKRVPGWLNGLNYQLSNQAISDQNGFCTVNCASEDDSCMQHYNGVVWKNLARRVYGRLRRVLGISPHTNQGSNILDKPPQMSEDHKFRYKSFQVESIDFSEFLESLSQKKPDKVVVKMDIEGAEFQVLDRFFTTKACENVSEMYVEFHERFFLERESEYKKKKQGYFERAERMRGLTLKEWH